MSEQNVRWPGVTVVDHPMLRVKLSKLRDRHTPPAEFRARLNEAAMLLAFEATRDLLTVPVEVQTPLARHAGAALLRPLALVPILRAGLGMAEGFSRMFPEASSGHIGLCRDETTHLPHEYYFRAPANLAECEVMVLDPMLATGGSAAAALSHLKERGARWLRLVTLVSAPTGIEKVRGAHPDVPIITGAVDQELNAHAYIVPGLGDAGDRYFGTE